MLDLGVVSATMYTWNKGGGYQPLQPRFVVHQGLARSTAVTVSWQLPEAGMREGFLRIANINVLIC